VTSVSAFAGIDASGLTDRGRVRPGNEDHFLIGQLDKSLLVTGTSLPAGAHRRLIGAPEGQVFCVADGLGGHAAGETASSTAIDATTQYLLNTMPCFFRARSLGEQELRSELSAAVQKAQRAVERRAARDQSMRGMGTTLTLAFLQWPRLFLVHVGDSRCYLRREALKQLTNDHTLLQQLIDSGRLPLGSKGDSMLGHALWNAVGGSNQELFVDISKIDLQGGDTLLLCSDGLVRHVTDAEIDTVLREHDSAAGAARALVEAANKGGGSDNITVIVARIPAGLGPEASLRLVQDPPDETRMLEPGGGA
jgi:PPM family protein phosphatase